MRGLAICGLILLALVLNSDAMAPVQLSGSNGQEVLSHIARQIQTNNTSASTGQSNTSTSTNLWNWGSIPVGYTVNNSGVLTPFEYANNGIWVPSI